MIESERDLVGKYFIKITILFYVLFIFSIPIKFKDDEELITILSARP